MKAGSAAPTREAVDGEPDRTVPDPADGRLGRWIAVVGLIAGVMVATALYAALPVTPFDLVRPETKRTLNVLLPEGWSFFTKSPRLPSMVAYRHDPQGGWHPFQEGAPSSPRYFMGFDRGGRAQGTELAMLTRDFERADWHPCTKDPLACLSETPTSGTVTNESHRVVCGDVGFVVQDVLPWAWRNAQTVMPSHVARARVTC